MSRPQFCEPPQLPVRWVGEATDGERLTEYAGRLQHGSHGNPAERSTQAFVEQARGQMHDSLLRHATYSVLLEGVSEALTGEVDTQPGLVCAARARRYVDASDARMVIPPAIAGDEPLERAWSAQMGAALERYGDLSELLLGRFVWVGDPVHRRALARDAAASVLPRCIERVMIATGSLDAWRGMIAHHGGERSDLEQRRLAVAVLRLLHREAPSCFSDLVVVQASDRREFVQENSHRV